MSEFGGDADVRGPYSAQQPLVKVGSLATFVAFVLFGNYVPVSLAVAVVLGIGTPAANWKGTAGALGFVAAMATIGVWTSGNFLRWLRGGELGVRGRCVFASICIIGSVAVAVIAAALHIWPVVLVVVLAAVVLALLGSWVLIKVGQAIGGAT